MKARKAVATGYGTSPQAWLQQAGLHARAGRWEEALDCAERASQLAPNDPETVLRYGQYLISLGRQREAYEAANRLASMDLGRAEWNDGLGALLTYCEDPARARSFFERAVSLAPANLQYRYNLATAQRMTGDLTGAEASLDQVLARATDYVPAHHMRSDLRTQTPQSNHIDVLEPLLRTVRDPRAQIVLCFALAKELEDVQRYEESFSYLQRGCDLQRRLMHYDVLQDAAVIDRIIQLHDSAVVERHSGIAANAPIFVVGLPRSGTTLVAQILASHGDVHSAGELQAFPLETVRAVQRITGRPVGKLEFVERSCEVAPLELGRAYLHAAQPPAANKPRFIDKQPLNYLYAGLICRALPGAKIVALAREPMDSCYAMYKTLFTNGYPFSYDLRDLAHYYTAWHRLLRHWQAVLGDRLLTVHYEDLVTDQEAVSHRILAHCGLVWEPGCLDFHHRTGAVTTASAVQVRRPLYSSSIGKWRFFERQLSPLAELLEQNRPAGGWRLS